VTVDRLTHRELLQRLTSAAGDDPLWADFVRRFQRNIRLVVYRTFSSESARSPGLDVGVESEAVEDLTQEVFLKLFDANRKAIVEFRGETEQAIFTYLNAIAVNVVRDHFKKLRARKTPRVVAKASDLGEASLSRAGEGADRASEPTLTLRESLGPDEFVAASELRKQIHAAIDEAAPSTTTSSRDRLVFRLFFLEGLTVDEIASVSAVGLSPSGVEKCIRRIRDTLKQTFSPK
jgi:RNA polymerase sigma factor (sigma-70 family)